MREDFDLIEVEDSEAEWLRQQDLSEEGLELAELDEVRFWNQTYDRAPGSSLYLPASDDPLERIRARRPKREAPTGLDLFCGAGGFSLGLHQAGFDVRGAAEWDACAAMTYLTNLGHPDCRIQFDSPESEATWNKRLKKDKIGTNWIGSGYRETVLREGRAGMTEGAANDYVREINDPGEFDPHAGCRGFYFGDIKKTTGDQLKELSQTDHFNVVFGGPPCQGLSTANSRACLEDPRNGLLWEFMRIVTEVKPDNFIIENVPQILTVGKGALFNALCSLANHAGYDVVANKLNAADYGVPQYRKRALIVGTLAASGKTFQFPMPTTWALGRQANGKGWSIGSDFEEVTTKADYDPATGKWKLTAPKKEKKAKPAQTDLLDEESDD